MASALSCWHDICRALLRYPMIFDGPSSVRKGLATDLENPWVEASWGLKMPWRFQRNSYKKRRIVKFHSALQRVSNVACHVPLRPETESLDLGVALPAVAENMVYHQGGGKPWRWHFLKKLLNQPFTKVAGGSGVCNHAALVKEFLCFFTHITDYVGFYFLGGFSNDLLNLDEIQWCWRRLHITFCPSSSSTYQTHHHLDVTWWYR